MTPRMLCVVPWLVVLAGCAAPPQVPPLRDGEAIRIVVIKSPQASGEMPIRNQALGSGVSAGAGSGAVVGGLWGLACGPFAVLCVPLGAATGVITGSVAGAAVGATGALDGDKSARLRDRLARALQSHDLLDELRRNVTDRARGHWLLDADPPGSVVTIELQDLQLTSTRDERIGLIVRVQVRVQPAGTPAAAVPPGKTYDHAGPVSPLEVWLDERADFLDTTFSSASQQLAAQIVSELARK